MLPFHEFLKHTQVITMLYGKSVGVSYYEKNVVNYYDFQKDALRELVHTDTIDSTILN